MYFNQNDDVDEDDTEDVHSFGGRDGVIFLIDAGLSMFDENESTASKFRTSIECVEVMMMNSIICGEKDLLGVVFYNTENSPTPKDESNQEPGLVVPKNSAIFMPLKTTSKETIQYIKNFRDSDDLFDFDNRYGHSDNTNFSDVLWLCSRMFARCGYKLQQSTIFLFTDKEQPHPAESFEYKQVMIKANDLQKNNIFINLIPFAEQFNGDLFYREFLATVTNESPEQIQFEESTQNLNKLMNRIFRKDFRKRCNIHMKMAIGNNLMFGVGFYNLSRKTNYPKSVHLLKDTNDIVVAKRTQYIGFPEQNNDDDDDDEDFPNTRYVFEKRLLPTDQRKSIIIGQEKMTFTVEETSDMKSLMAPGIRLLGFKPKTKVTVHQYLRPANFLYPDETTIKGSTNIFRALWQKCLEKEKIAICVLTLRRKTAPRYVALVPQDIEFDSENEQRRQNGFRVVYLPCEVHIRNLDVFDKIKPEIIPEGVNLCEKLIKKLKFKYKPEQFENPAIKTMYANLEALAYETVDVHEIEDTTLPDLEQQNNKIGQFIDEFNKVFGEIKINPTAKRAGARIIGTETRTKIQKIQDEDIPTDEIISAVENNTAEKYSVAALKLHLGKFGLKGLSKMNKTGLIDKIREHHKL